MPRACYLYHLYQHQCTYQRKRAHLRELVSMLTSQVLPQVFQLNYTVRHPPQVAGDLDSYHTHEFLVLHCDHSIFRLRCTTVGDQVTLEVVRGIKVYTAANLTNLTAYPSDLNEAVAQILKWGVLDLLSNPPAPAPEVTWPLEVKVLNWSSGFINHL